MRWIRRWRRPVLHSRHCAATVLAVAGTAVLSVGCADGVAAGIQLGKVIAAAPTEAPPATDDSAVDGAKGSSPEPVPPTTTEVDPTDSESISVDSESEEPPSPEVEEPSPGGTLVAHVIGDEISAFTSPSSKTIAATFQNPNRHGGPMVFQAVVDPGSKYLDLGWIPVLLPVRPNGTVGWIRTSEVDLTRNPYRIEVDVDDFTLTVFRHDELHFSTSVGIGVGETPTPYGSFFLTDLLKPSDPTGIYGPYAYGLSGFSESLDSFNGGPGVIGIHGTNRPDAIGTRVSHGCVRVSNDAITEMATFLPLGTPVIIGDEPSNQGQ